MSNAKLALDPRHCWVDTWTFSRLTAACSLPASLDAGGQPFEKVVEAQQRLVGPPALAESL